MYDLMITILIIVFCTIGGLIVLGVAVLASTICIIVYCRKKQKQRQLASESEALLRFAEEEVQNKNTATEYIVSATVQDFETVGKSDI